MTTRTRTVSILDSDKLPFLLRTGKVQQNAQDRGEGQWSVPHGGFTSQLKYKQTAGRFEGELAGFIFCRYTPADGIFNTLGRAQTPHIWLFEQSGSGDGGALINGGGQDGTTAGWSAGANTTPSSIATSNPYTDGGTAIKIKRSTGTGTGTVSISQSSVTSAGAGYIIKGAIQKTSGGTLTIYNGTERIWPNAAYQANPDNTWARVSTYSAAFAGSGTGDAITVECTSLPEGAGDYVLFTLQIEAITVTAREIWMCNNGAGYHAADLDAMKARALARINAATTSAEYEIENGDLVCTTPGYSAFLGGCIPWLCGWGFIPAEMANTAQPEEDALFTNMNSLSWANNPGAIMPFSSLRATKANPVADPQYNFESAVDSANGTFRSVDFERLPVVALRNTQGLSTPPCMIDFSGDLIPATLRKNHSEHRYYWESNPDTNPKTATWKKLYNSPSNPFLRYYPKGGLYLQAGDVVSIAGSQMRVTAEDASSTIAGARTITVEGRQYLNSTVWVDEIMHGAPTSIAWMVGWYDYFEANPSELPVGASLSSVDPHPIRDVSETMFNDPALMLKELLGYGNSIGLPLASICTTICDLFGRYDSDRELIDFVALARLVKSAGLTGARYQLEGADPTTEGNPPPDMDILRLINGLCSTHGIRMVWSYSDTQRAWRMTFRPDSAMTVADSYFRSRVIDEHTALLEKPSEVIGGDFNYSGIKAKYKQMPNTQINFDVTDPSGRIQHTGPRVLEIKDTMTVLPSGSDVLNKLGSDFGNRVLTLSFLSSRLKMATTIKSAGILRVGDSIAVDVAHLRNPKTGRQDGSLLCAEINSVATDLGKTPRCNVEMTLSRLALSGISPSLNVDAWTRTGDTVSVTGCATTPTNNDYSPTDGGLTDLATFGCYSYDDDAGIYLRPCGCGEYACWIALRDPSTKTWQIDVSIWPCTVGSIDVASGTCDITLLSGESAFPASTSGAYVLFFASRDNAGLQPCQTDYYGWLGNSADVVVDSTGAESAPASVG